MDYLAIATLALKGLSVIEAAISTGNDATVAVTALKNVFTKKESELTQVDYDAADRVLDDQLAEFNKPI